MKYENQTINAGVLGSTKYFILRGMPTDDPKIDIYLLSHKDDDDDEDEKLEYSLWNVETLDNKESFDIWPYKGEDYEVRKKKLLEDFVENWSLDNYCDVEEKEELNNEEKNKMKQTNEVFMSTDEKFFGFIDEGADAYVKKDNDKAIIAFEKALAISDEHYPDDPKAQEIRKLLNLLNEEKSLAGQESDKLADEAKKLAEIFGIKVEDVNTVITYKDEILQYASWKKEVIATFYYIRGLIFMSKGEYVKAIEDYSNAMDYEPDSITLYQERPEVFQERNKTNFDGLTLSDFMGTFALQKRGRAYLDNGDFDKAIEDFERIIKFDTSFNSYLAKAYMYRGFVYNNKKDYNNAFLDYKKSYELDPNDTVLQLRDIMDSNRAKQ